MSTDNSDNDYPPVKKNLTDDNYMLNKKKPTNKTIQKMKEKYGETENFIKEGTPPKEKILKDESKDNLSKAKEKNKKKNRNRNVGNNNHNNYAPDMYVPRKVCAKCGSVNHLSINCKTNSTPMFSPTVTPSQPLMFNLAPPNLSALTTQFASMPFINPFFAYNMNFSMPWNMNMNNDYSLYASQFVNTMNSDLSKIEPVNVPMTKSQTPMIKTEPSSSKPVVANSCKKSKVGTNKA